VIFIIKVQAPC